MLSFFLLFIFESVLLLLLLCGAGPVNLDPNMFNLLIILFCSGLNYYLVESEPNVPIVITTWGFTNATVKGKQTLIICVSFLTTYASEPFCDTFRYLYSFSTKKFSCDLLENTTGNNGTQAE